MSEHAPLAAYEHNGQPVSADRFYAIACDPRRSVAVEACAGAGKTWMLVSRIVRALLENTPGAQPPVAPHEILAITFTKRAASEMRERLVQWLEEFSTASESDLLIELRKRGVDLPEAQRGAAAKNLSQLYRRVLHSGRQVQIRTFHSWFAALLRMAPLAVLQQLALPLNYELLEDDAPATALVWRRFYQRLVDDAEHKADFEAVVLEHGRSQTGKALAIALDKRVEFSVADRHGVVAASVQHFHQMFPDLRQFADPADALDQPTSRARWLGWARELGREANGTPQKAAHAILDAFAPADVRTGAASMRLEALREAFFVQDEDRLTRHLQNYPAAQQAGHELARLCAARHQHKAWLYQQRMLRLTRVLAAEYAALKRERGWIDMSDVESAAQVLLSDPVLSGWVQERLDLQVRHLLVDEFQDTNPLQWQALASWLGSYAGAGARAPSVFIVGDPKQSIYRFRRAEPQVFRAAQQFVATGLGGDLLSCDHTRRNARKVIALVNATMAAARVDDGYEGFREHTTDSAAAGRVCSLPPVPRPSAAETALTGNWRDSLTTPRELPEETLRTQEARQVARWIADQIDGGVEPSALMVLSRRRAGLLPMQQELRALRIPAQIGEKTALGDCCEVQDIVALLDCLVSNQHDLSLARALRSPVFGKPDQALVDLALRRRQHELNWFGLLQQPWPTDHALHGIGQTLSRWKAWVDRLPPHDALQAIYTDGRVLERFAVAAPPVQRETVLANLRALLGAALQLGGGRYATPYAFVRALKAGGVVAPAAVDEHAVRLLTIHGAKGLEAHAVVLLDTDTAERTSETMGVLVDWPGHAAYPGRFVFVAREARPPACAVATLEQEKAQRQREELNALYVAMTRARHTLLVSSITPLRDAPGSWWRRLSPLIDERISLSDITAAERPAVTGGDRWFDMVALPPAPPVPASATPAPRNNGGLAEAPADDDSVQARIGKAMHRLLEWGATSEQNSDAAAREFGLEAEQGELARRLAQRIFSGKGAWAWNPALVKFQANEVELMVHGQPYRLDRLVQRSDTGDWWVLDFKSASSPQQQPALMAQMQNYRDAVQQIYPGQTVRAAFLTAAGEQIEVPRPLASGG